MRRRAVARANATARRAAVRGHDRAARMVDGNWHIMAQNGWLHHAAGPRPIQAPGRSMGQASVHGGHAGRGPGAATLNAWLPTLLLVALIALLAGWAAEREFEA